MATIYPFRGFRYNAEKVGRVSDVVTQPYDKIPDSLKAEYLERSPFNVVRVIKNQNYSQAAQFLDRWIEEGIMEQDAKPSVYVYEQVFDFEGLELSRKGFICLVSLDDEDLVVKGHERVLDKPLADRLNLIRATEANEGLVFTLFSDPELSVDALLDKCTLGRDPVLAVVDDFGVTNRLWQVADVDALARIDNLMKSKALYIADGHHRFQTSVSYNQECVRNGWTAGAVESFDKRLVAMFNMDSEGMRILATHRAVRNVSNLRPQGLLADLEARFLVTHHETEGALFEAMEGKPLCLGVVAKGLPGAYQVALRPESLQDSSFMPSVEGPSRELDVNVLHQGILQPHLGLGPNEVASGDFVSYFRDRHEIIRSVREGENQVAFLLNATTLEQVRVISELGEKMPQKSTDFYPKLLTGLVIMKMEIGKNH